MRESPTSTASFQPKRGRDDLEEQFRRDADRRPEPHHRIRDRREHRERHRHARIVALEAEHRGDHQRAPDPRADDDEHEANIEEGASGQRRIEREEHRRPAEKNVTAAITAPIDREDEAEPGEARHRKRAPERRLGDVIAKTHYHEGGEHIGHRDAVCGNRDEIGLCRQERRRQRASRPHLPDAEHRRDREGREGDPKWASVKRLAWVTGRPPVRSGLEFRFRHHPHASPTSGCARDRNIHGRASGDRPSW